MKNYFETSGFAAQQVKESELQDLSKELLFLIPLIQVAWAQGIVSAREKRLIFKAAREDGIDERSPLNDILNEWLIYQPSRRFFNDCLEHLKQLFSEMTVKERDRKKAKLISRCTGVAGIAGDERLDTDGYISYEELQSLAQIIETINYRAPKSASATLKV